MENCYNKSNLTPINKEYMRKKFDFKFSEILS